MNMIDFAHIITYDVASILMVNNLALLLLIS